MAIVVYPWRDIVYRIIGHMNVFNVEWNVSGAGRYCSFETGRLIATWTTAKTTKSIPVLIARRLLGPTNISINGPALVRTYLAHTPLEAVRP
nr:uncharacterized protein CI109_004122 [Kwoniella shandongensis]KAA5527583.1 hypothetical protein CI109_004122 [Kwoniella shandongensis]